MEKYYYKINNGRCIERCNVLKDGTKIGSTICRQCVFNEGESDDTLSDWIKCSQMDKETLNDKIKKNKKEIFSKSRKESKGNCQK